MADLLTNNILTLMPSINECRLTLETGVPLSTTSTTTTEDSGGYTGTTQVGAKRFLWNYSNRVRRPMYVKDTADTWSYTTNTWRVANGATAPLNCVEYITGDATILVEASLVWMATIVNNSARGAFSGIGLDSSTNAPVGRFGQLYNTDGTSQQALAAGAFYSGHPGLGYHYLAWMEKGADGTCSFHGDTGGTDQCGVGAWLAA